MGDLGVVNFPVRLEETEDDAGHDPGEEDDPELVGEGHHDPGDGRHRGGEQEGQPHPQLHVDEPSGQTAQDVPDEEQTGNPGTWQDKTCISKCPPSPSSGG